MTNDEAITWARTRFEPDEVARLNQIVSAVEDENTRQNLIAPSTVPLLWSRHIVDSLQLAGLAKDISGSWLDIGTGGGFPGLAVAVVRTAPMRLVEPRKRRAAFLESLARALGIASRVSVHATKVEALSPMIATIVSARAVGSIETILRIAAHVSDEKTLWLLPRGRFDPEEMVDLRRRWSFMFHVEQSLTDANSSIVMMTEVRSK